MRKLHLDLDQLEVESFETTVHNEALRGTVRGAADTEGSTCGGCDLTNNCQGYTVGCTGHLCLDTASMSGLDGCLCPPLGNEPSRPC